MAGEEGDISLDFLLQRLLTKNMTLLYIILHGDDPTAVSDVGDHDDGDRQT